VHKLSDFKMGEGAQKKEMLAYTFIPEPENPCWWKCCCYPLVSTCMLSNPLTFYGGCALCCMGSAGAYGTLCTNETIEYGIKDGVSNNVIYTFQNDNTGFSKACCGGLGVPQDDGCANCDALTKMSMYRNVSRTIFNGSSKDGTHEGEAPRQEVATITRTSLMMPAAYCPNMMCCATEVEGHPMGSLAIDSRSGEGVSDEESIRLALIMYSANTGWVLFDSCLDSDPIVRTGMTVPINASGDASKDDPLHASVTYSNFQQAIAKNGILDVGNLIDNMKAVVK
jgi:hypothetical protein